MLFLSMGLSLSLFSLTLLEAMPKSTMVLLHSESSLRLAYWTFLSALSVHIILVLPSLAGASVAESFGDFFLPSTRSMDKDDCKYPFWLNWRKLPWWVRFLVGLLQIIFRGLCRTICFFGRGQRWSSSSTTSSELVMTVHDEREHLQKAASTDTLSDGSVAPASPTRRSSLMGSPLNRRHAHNISWNARRNILLALGSFTGILTTLAMLSTIGPMVVQPPADKDTTTLSRVISWLCAVGLLLSSLLNGFGSVSLPFTYLSGIFFKTVRPETVTKMSAELRSMQEALAKKRMTVKELSVEITTPTSANTTTTTATSSRSSGISGSGGRSSVATSFGSISGFGMHNTSTANAFSDIKEDIKNRRLILQTEIDFLEDLIRETSLDMEEMKYSQAMAAAARTNTGRIKSWVGMVFSVILLLRLFNAGFSIWTSSTVSWKVDSTHKMSRNDLVTTALLWLTGRDYISQKRYMMLSQMVSLGLTAVLSFSQVRMFLRTVAVVNRRLSSFWKKCWCGTSSSGAYFGLFGFHSQVIAGFLGCYSVACIVLIKMMLPTKFSDSFSAALGESDIFTIHAAMVDLVFFSSAMISTSILAMLLGIQRQNNLRHAATTNDKAYYGPEV